jgi:beta-N-acetylhexosaminidase
MRAKVEIGQKLLLAFHGKESLPPEIQQAIRRYRPGGFTLFRASNIEQPEQVRALTAQLQHAAREEGLPPFIIAADQEGGQLMAVSEGATQLPGNMALGATGSSRLARLAGEVLGCEMAALGINVNYAPSLDVNSNPGNPVIGVRSFGEDAELAARLGAALIEGIQSRGCAATAKHFPGHGDTESDSHHGLPVVRHSLERLRQVELPPFSAAVQAGVQIVMTAHLALPALDGREDLPATLSSKILKGLLREELGFRGVIVTDAMDMQAIGQGEIFGEQALRAAAAGADLLLLTHDPSSHRAAFEKLAGPGALDTAEAEASLGRIRALKRWLASRPPQPGLEHVGCPAHLAVAEEIAARSITLLRDHSGLLPLRPAETPRLVVVMPQPQDLTPADTSSYIRPALAGALRQYYAQVDELTVPHQPQEQDIAAVLEQVRNGRYRALVLGTLNAYTQPGQAELARALLEYGIPVIIAALRLPYDLAAFPQAPTYLCTYSLLEPSMQALARTLCGETQARGRLPVSIPGLYPRGACESAR